jgi:carbonic anhydrase/acetyltransferase-like protein (isoleucine patch superfamily)
MGAVLLNHVHVGEGSIVAAGALVVENTVIPPRSLYMGVPAKRRREVTEAELAFIKRHGTNYLRYKEQYLAKGTPTLAAALGESGKPQGA